MKDDVLNTKNKLIYWWRFNGGGFAICTTVGMITALLQRFLIPGMDKRIQFSLLLVISLISTVIGTYLTRPTEKIVLKSYHAFLITLTVFLICLTGMYFLWYKKMEP